MFDMGTMLVHPTYGVCEVVCIDKISMKNVKDERLFYTLVPLYDKKSKLFIPIESENIGLRPIMTKEDALKLVQSLPAMDPIDVPNEKVREQLYGELAVSLGIKKEEVEDYITRSIENK